jgi:membrane-associated phospholipid phosphatase
MNKRFLYKIILILVLLFSILALTVEYAPEYVLGIDAYVYGLLAPLQTYTGILVFLGVTSLGSIFALAAVSFGVIYFLRHEHFALLRLSAALLGSGFFVYSIKLLMSRIRPEGILWITKTDSYSFPSGHATTGMVLYGFILIVAYRHIHRWYYRIPIVAAASAVIISIGLSRLVLHVHYFSDVIGGYLLGGVFLTCIFLIPFRKLEKRLKLHD